LDFNALASNFGRTTAAPVQPLTLSAGRSAATPSLFSQDSIPSQDNDLAKEDVIA
jgi:hypothetical protein